MPSGKKRPTTVLVAFRVPVELAQRLDELAGQLSTPWHEVRRGELARAAMERGLRAMQEEAEAKKPA